MRWKYLVPRVVIVGLVWGFFVWAFDPIMLWMLVKTGQRLNGAKVDVEGLTTHFFPPALELAKVQVADKGKSGRNLVEWDTFRLKLSGGALAHRKLVIEEGSITGLMWNTARADSGQLEDSDSFHLGDHVLLEDLRKQVSELGKTWLKEALGAAKSQLDPNQLETVKVSKALKDQWLAKFQAYEARIKTIEDRVKALKDGVKPQGNTLQKVEAYRQAALEVQRLLADVQAMRQELSQLGPSAGADLKQIELARERDLKNIHQKLKILTLDKESLPEALLGRDVVAALEEAMDWVKWTKENVSRFTASKEPERSRGMDVPFPEPVDPHPGFLIKRLHVSGTARINGEMVPYSGMLSDVSSDAKRWGKPTVLEITTDGTSKIHLAAIIDRSLDEPVFDIRVTYHLPKPTKIAWGDEEQMAVQIQAAETLWEANLKVVGDEVAGKVSFRQNDVRIETHSKYAPKPMQVASIEPVRFEWEPKQELHRAIAGVFDQVTELDAAVSVTGKLADPKWTFSSTLGPKVSAGVENYLAGELARRKSEALGELEKIAGNEIASFRGELGEKFRGTMGRLSVTETEANALVQKFAGRPLDVKGLFR
jgi:uncharacterized protein (TIGR03545 family)